MDVMYTMDYSQENQTKIQQHIPNVTDTAEDNQTQTGQDFSKSPNRNQTTIGEMLIICLLNSKSFKIEMEYYWADIFADNHGTMN